MSKRSETKGHQHFKPVNTVTGEFTTREFMEENPEITMNRLVPDPGYGLKSSKVVHKDARDGEFVTEEYANAHPRTTARIRVPKGGGK